MTYGRRRTAARERLLARLALLLAMSLLFVAAEVGLRVYARFSAYIPKAGVYDRPHYFLGRLLVPNADFVGRAGSIHINSRGFRGREFEVPKPAGVYRIFALGGSTTFGYYPATSSDDTAYPAVLERLLNNERPAVDAQRFEVVNAGVPGYSARTTLQNLAGRVMFLQPDMIVVYHATNDLARYGNELNLTHPLLNQFVPMGIADGILDGVLGWSYAAQEIRFTIGRRLFGALMGAAPGGGDIGRDWKLDSRYPEAFRRDLRNIVALARTNGIAVVLATQSIAFRKETDFANLNAAEKQMMLDKPADFYAVIPPPHRYEMFQLYNRIVKEVAVAEGAILADVDGEIPKTPEYHWDYCHLTDKGSALQAAVIHRAILHAEAGGRLAAGRAVH